MIMKKDKYNLYYLTPFKNSHFYDQFEWAEETIQRESQYVFNSDFKVFQPREIYEYVKGIDIRGNERVIGKCVILDVSGKFESKVLVCPIYPKTTGDNKFGINIGKIYGLSTEDEYIAALSEIKFISKRSFKVNTKTVSEAKNLCLLPSCSYLTILESYKKIIESIIRKVTDVSLNICQNPQILSA